MRKKQASPKRYPYPRDKRSHLRGREVLKRRIQTYNQGVAELFPLVLPFSTKGYRVEQMPPQKDGTIVRIFHISTPEGHLKLTYSLPGALVERYFSSEARQRGNINYPALGKDLKPVTLGLLNLSTVQKSPQIVFTLEDLAVQIGLKQTHGWRKHLRDLITTIGTTKYELFGHNGELEVSGTIGAIAFPGKMSARFGFKLQPDEAFFSFNWAWLLPYPNRFGQVPYFIMLTDEAKAFRDLPDYMKNGYFWLISHRYSLHKITPRISTFLRKGFGLSEGQIEDWQKHGRLRANWRNFLREMKTMDVLQRTEYLTKEGRDLTNYVVRFIPTKTFLEQATIDILPDTPEYRDRISSYLDSMRREKKSAKWVLEEFLLHCPDAMKKNILSGKFDSMVKKGYYDQFK